MRYFRVELGGFGNWMLLDYRDLSALQKSWVQQEQHWTLFFFDHDGMISINNRPIPFQSGNIAFVPPGTKAEFQRVGPETPAFCFTFEIIPRTDVVAIPAVADLGPTTEVRRQDFQESMDWINVSMMRGLACAYNTLWAVAQPITVFRRSDLIYDAEDLIGKRIAEPLRVALIAAELGISQSELLRLFHEEHHCTVQQFIRQRRGERARYLIMTTDLPLKAIAGKTGMSDLQYFNKVVRGLTGVSPRGLRMLSKTRTQH